MTECTIQACVHCKDDGVCDILYRQVCVYTVQKTICVHFVYMQIIVQWNLSIMDTWGL